MTDVFALIGFSTLILVLICLVWCLTVSLLDWIDKRIYLYKCKRRFNKTPTAKCYCRDCKKHSVTSNRCYKFDGWNTANDWFCWDAEPRKKGE